MPSSLLSLLRGGTSTAMIAVLIYFSSVFCAGLLFDQKFWTPARPADLTLHLLLALLLSTIFSRRWSFALTFGAFTLLLHLGHAAKMASLGGPLSPDDYFAFKAFISIAEPWQRNLVLGGGALILLTLLSGFGWRQPRRLLAAMVLLALGVGLTKSPQPLLAWMDRQFGHVEWDPAGNFQRRGPTVHSLQEITRFLATSQPIPRADEVAAALPSRVTPDGLTKPGVARNLHVIVLESFWDAGQLKAALSEDPLPEDFRALWGQTGESRILSPVFGGYTANAEFEALCGFPVTEPSVRFERNLTRQVACLPAVLGQDGYASVASHPNIPVFWNRNNVYQRIGFERFWAGADFTYDDMNGGFLSDRSLYRQVLEKIDPLLEGDKPLFNYVLTFFGHLPYPLSSDRPPIFESKSAHPDVAAYASTLHYKARDLMEFLAALRERDPEGLIVVFGDHLPVLGGLGAYVESGLVAAERADYTPDMYLTLAATPLIIIDGKNGPVPLGNLPMYRLPSLILTLLGNGSRTLFDFTASPEGMQVRPLVGMNLNLLGDRVEVCQDGSASESCEVSASWLDRVRVLAADLFIGDQHALAPSVPETIGGEASAVELEAEVSAPRADGRDS